MISEATVVAIIDESRTSKSPICTCEDMTSDAMNVTCANTMVSVILAVSFSRVRPTSFEKSPPMNAPKSTPPMIMMVKLRIPSPTVVNPWNPKSTTSSTTRKSATDVASLKRLSPSNISESLRGAPYSLKRASTATGSVAEMSAPKRRVIVRGTATPSIASTAYSRSPITAVDTRRLRKGKDSKRNLG